MKTAQLNYHLFAAHNWRTAKHYMNDITERRCQVRSNPNLAQFEAVNQHRFVYFVLRYKDYHKNTGTPGQAHTR